MTAPATSSPTVGRRTVPVVVAALVLLGVVLALGPTRTGLPLAPDAAGDDGLLGLVRTLEDLEVEVEVTTRPPESVSTRAFVPLDVLPERRRDEWRTWVASGGTLVVADPSSRLHDEQVVAPPFGELMAAVEHPPGCDLLPAEITRILHDRWTGYLPPTDVSCFDLDDAAWLVEVPRGDGRMILLGSAAPFTNRWLAEADNAVLAATLLGPEVGDTLTFVPRPSPEEADVTLVELVPDGVWRLLGLVTLAVVLAVVARARRLGQPVEERLPPVVPSAELASSIADLTRRAGDRQGAAARLRARARHDVAHALGLPRGTPPQEVLRRLVATAPLDETMARRALLDDPVGDDDELIEVARSIATLHDRLEGPVLPADDGVPPGTPTSPR